MNESYLHSATNPICNIGENESGERSSVSTVSVKRLQVDLSLCNDAYQL
jgi:hypothetical protein